MKLKKKLSIQLPYDPAIPGYSMSPKELKTGLSSTHLHTDINSNSVTRNNQKVEANQAPIG